MKSKYGSSNPHRKWWWSATAALFIVAAISSSVAPEDKQNIATSDTTESVDELAFVSENNDRQKLTSNEESSEEGREPTSTLNSDSQTATQDELSEPTAEVQELEEVNALSAPQENALRSAESYLEYSAFSRQGLIDQLSSEHGDKYDLQDATFAVENLEVDWNEQAVKSAESYLEYSAFSCQGLIDQLSSEHADKFTQEQATYGAKKSEVC